MGVTRKKPVLDRAALIATGQEWGSIREQVGDFLAFLEQMADGPLPGSHPIVQRRSALEVARSLNVMSSPLISQAMLAWFGWGDSLMNGTLLIDLEKETQLRKRLRNPRQYLD